MKLFINFLLYFGTEVLNKAIPFLLLPLITKYLTPQEYGTYGMYQVVVSFMTPFIVMNAQANITKNFFKVSKKQLANIITSLLLILHLHIFVALIVIYFVSLVFSNPFNISTDILYIMPIIIYAQTINTFNLTILRNQKKAFYYGSIQIFITIVNYSTTLSLLVFFNKGWESLVYGVLVAQLLFATYSLKNLYSSFSLKWKFYSLKEIYIVSVPLIFHTLGGSLISMSDRIFIEKMINIDNVGIYMIGVQFGMIAAITINTIMMTLNPWFYRALANEENQLVRKSYILMFGFLVLGIFIWLFSLAIFSYVIDEKFILAKEIIFWITMSFVIRGWYQIFFNVIVHEGKTKIFMYITFTGGTMNLILNYFFIKLNGIIGAAQATLIVYSVIFILTFYYANKYSKLTWSKVK